MKITGAQALIKSLEQESVEVIFGLPGSAGAKKPKKLDPTVTLAEARDATLTGPESRGSSPVRKAGPKLQ